MCTTTPRRKRTKGIAVAHTSTESTIQITPPLSPHSSDQLAIPIGSHMVQIYSALSLFTSVLSRHAIGRKTGWEIGLSFHTNKMTALELSLLRSPQFPKCLFLMITSILCQSSWQLVSIYHALYSHMSRFVNICLLYCHMKCTVVEKLKK